jgi:hypothetical protein
MRGLQVYELKKCCRPKTCVRFIKIYMYLILMSLLSSTLVQFLFVGTKSHQSAWTSWRLHHYGCLGALLCLQKSKKEHEHHILEEHHTEEEMREEHHMDTHTSTSMEEGTNK